MMDGAAQSLGRGEDRRLALTRFADFTIDISDITQQRGGERVSLREIFTLDLLKASPELITRTGATRAAILEEAHSRIAGSLLGIAAPLLGFAALMLGSYSRFGLWRQIGGAVLLIILLQMLSTAGAGAALRSKSGWPLVYVAPLFGVVLTVILLWIAGRPRRLKRTPLLPDAEPQP